MFCRKVDSDSGLMDITVPPHLREGIAGKEGLFIHSFDHHLMSLERDSSNIRTRFYGWETKKAPAARRGMNGLIRGSLCFDLS